MYVWTSYLEGFWWDCSLGLHLFTSFPVGTMYLKWINSDPQSVVLKVYVEEWQLKAAECWHWHSPCQVLELSIVISVCEAINVNQLIASKSWCAIFKNGALVIRSCFCQACIASLPSLCPCRLQSTPSIGWMEGPDFQGDCTSCPSVCSIGGDAHLALGSWSRKLQC